MHLEKTPPFLSPDVFALFPGGKNTTVSTIVLYTRDFNPN